MKRDLIRRVVVGLVGLGLLGILAFALACAPATAPPGATPAPKEAPAKTAKGKRVFVLMTSRSHPFMNVWSVISEEQGRARGMQVTVLNDNYSPAEQASFVDQAIAQKADAIAVVATDAVAIVPPLQRAKAAGIPVFLLIGPIAPGNEGLYVSGILNDNPALGRIAGQLLVKGMKEAGYTSGNVIAITGTKGQLIVGERMVTFKEELAKNPEFKLVEEQDGEWDQAKTNAIAAQLFVKYKDRGGIQGAYGSADNQAAGIIEAAQAAGIPLGVAKKGLIVVGSNCLVMGIQNIKAGTQYGTGTQVPNEGATKALNLIADWFEGKSLQKEIRLTEEAITLGNIQQWEKPCTY